MENYFSQESERLRFRKLTKDDIPTWTEFFVDNDRLHYLGLDLSKSNAELAQYWINLQLRRYKKLGYGHLAAELKDNGSFIGMGGIIPRELDGRNEYEIGYSLFPKFWGHGYATEIARTMKSYAIQNIDSDRFISIIEINNKASANVAVKNGMNVLFKTQYMGMTVDVYGIENK